MSYLRHTLSRMNDTKTVPANHPDLLEEIHDCWRRLPSKAFFFTLLTAWLVLFQFFGNPNMGYIHSPSLFGWMWEAYNGAGASSNDAYGNLIPFIVLGLFWWKRRELLKLPLTFWPPALLLIFFGLALHVLGYVVQESRISIVAMFLGIYGLMGLTWGIAWLRHSFFPFVLFIFSVPVSEFLLPITFPLRILVSTLTEWVAHYILGIGVLRVGTQLFDPMGKYQYDVAAACSGIRSLVAIFLLAIVYGFITFRSPWKRMVLMALALPLSVLGNLVRMLFIITAAEIGGQSWGNYVHENLFISLIPYIPAIGGLFAVGWLLEKRELKKTSE
jgi:exosortase